jgi:acetoin utilization deacetylase AcuC-like enzyme
MTAFYTHPAFLAHEMGPHHPESPARLWAINDHLTRKGLMPLLRVVEPGVATDDDLLRVHDQSHLDFLVERSPKGKRYQALDPDTAMNEHTLFAAYLAAGAVITAVNDVMSGRARNAFCAVRPPGHHAERKNPMGFCFFNNVAVGAAYALDVLGLTRVAIIDFDVHHGNGTEDIFANDDRVLMVSTFEQEIYPFRGDIPLGRNMVNMPLQAYSNGGAMREAVLAHWLPALDQFQPQLILVSAGFDAHREDDLSHLLWTDQDYAWLSEQIVLAAKKHCNGKIVSALEGGYATEALARSVGYHIDALLVAG